MLKHSLLTLAILGSSYFSFAQSKNDILYLAEGTKEVQVKEIGPNTIKYSYPSESIVYTISKHQVAKISYASGREEIFDSPIKKVKGLDNAPQVYVTYNNDEVTGLEPIGQLFSKATGVTALSSVNNVKNRALDKLKAEAAMIGANVILVGSVYQRGNQFGGENQASNATQTTFLGAAYSTAPLDKEKTVTLLTGQKYHHYQTHKLNRNSFSPERLVSSSYDSDRQPLLFEFDKIVEKEDGVYVSSSHLPVKGRELKVISADSDAVILMERNKKSVINYYLISKEHNLFTSR
jgi:hypothetical protein